jgi:hypothetical protein
LDLTGIADVEEAGRSYPGNAAVRLCPADAGTIKRVDSVGYTQRLAAAVAFLIAVLVLYMVFGYKPS